MVDRLDQLKVVEDLVEEMVHHLRVGRMGLLQVTFLEKDKVDLLAIPLEVMAVGHLEEEVVVLVEEVEVQTLQLVKEVDLVAEGVVHPLQVDLMELLQVPMDLVHEVVDLLVEVVVLVVEEQVHPLQVDPMEPLQGDHQVGLVDLVVEEVVQHLQVDRQEEVAGLVVEEVVHPLQVDPMELLLGICLVEDLVEEVVDLLVGGGDLVEMEQVRLLLVDPMGLLLVDHQ